MFPSGRFAIFGGPPGSEGPGLDPAEIVPGRRGFLVDIAHAGVWNDVIDSFDVSPDGANTMARLSSYIVSRAYDDLLAYVRRMEEE